MRLIWIEMDMRFFRYTTGYEIDMDEMDMDDMDEMDMRFFRYTTGYEMIWMRLMDMRFFRIYNWI